VHPRRFSIELNPDQPRSERQTRRDLIRLSQITTGTECVKGYGPNLIKVLGAYLGAKLISNLTETGA
jgi:hypothetical protein